MEKNNRNQSEEPKPEPRIREVVIVFEDGKRLSYTRAAFVVELRGALKKHGVFV